MTGLGLGKYCRAKEKSRSKYVDRMVSQVMEKGMNVRVGLVDSLRIAGLVNWRKINGLGEVRAGDRYRYNAEAKCG